MSLSLRRRYLLAAAIATVFLLIGVFSANSVISAILIIITTSAVTLLHLETQEGGAVSRLIYRHGISPAKGDISVAIAAAMLIFIWLLLAGLFYTPLLGLFIIPISLAAMRGGLRSSIKVALVIFVALNLFFAFDPNGNQTRFVFGFLFSLIFVLLALVSGSLASRLRRSAMDLTALYETGKAISASLRLEEILNMVVNIIYIDMAVDFCTIFLKDDTTDTLKIEASRGLEKDEAVNVRVRIGEGITGWVMKYAQALSIEELDSRQLQFLMPGIKSVIAAPLVISGNPVGAVLAGKDERRFFGREELEFLEALAGQTANAIRNARLYSETEQYAIRDGLTGSYNYRYFTKYLNEQMLKAIHDKSTLSLIMIDIDHFKKINDTYGHIVGDKVLKSLARLLDRNTRETDLVARYGGEEFVIVLPEAKYEDAFRVAAKLRETVERASFLAREREISSLKITISLGVAVYPTNAVSEADLIAQADKSLYAAKEYRNAACSPLECEGPKTFLGKEQDAGIKKTK